MSEAHEHAVFLAGDKLDLCPMRREDAMDYVRWLNDPEVAHYLSMHKPLTFEQEMEIIEEMLRAKPTETVNLAIWPKDMNRPIGNIGLLRINPIDRNAMIGIFIGNRNYWGKGYASNAMRILMRYGFKTLNLEKIWLGHFSGNERGRKVYDKLGFAEVGRLHRHKYIDGDWQDEVFMEIFKDDFARINGDGK